MDPVLIGELSRLTGVSTRMLRYYEEKGLLAPVRLPNGYRIYCPHDIERTRCLRELFARGLSAQMIASDPTRIARLDRSMERADPLRVE